MRDIWLGEALPIVVWLAFIREPVASTGSEIVLGVVIAVFVGVAIWIHHSNKGRKRKDDGEV